MIVGRVASDIEVKTLESGKEVTRVLLAVNRSFKNQDENFCASCRRKKSSAQ